MMGKFVGVTPQQLLRVQALLKLGVTEEDVRLAAELLRPRNNEVLRRLHRIADCCDVSYLMTFVVCCNVFQPQARHVLCNLKKRV